MQDVILQHPDSVEIMNGDDGDDASEADDGSDQPFMVSSHKYQDNFSQLYVYQ